MISSVLIILSYRIAILQLWQKPVLFSFPLGRTVKRQLKQKLLDSANLKNPTAVNQALFHWLMVFWQGFLLFKKIKNKSPEFREGLQQDKCYVQYNM